MSDTTSQTSHRSVLFADIVSSTALYEEIGNLKAKETVGSCLDALSAIVVEHDGRVVKSMGDGILCAFSNSEEAVNSALAMCDKAPAHKLSIRVGVHCGEVVQDAGDIFGDAVNTASRIAGLAKPLEILISRELRETLPPFMKSLVRSVQPVSVKGKREPLELFAILRGSASHTMASFSPLVDLAKQARLEVTYAGKTVEVEREHSEITLGREAENDVVIDNKYASRQHARIYHRLGKFVLVDQSANGTFLVPEDQSRLHLHREEALLHGSGSIYFGADPTSQETEPVHFRVRS